MVYNGLMGFSIIQEVDKWVKEGIITPEQAEKIKSRYPQREFKKFTHVLYILSALLIGGGILLFVASNWEKIPIIYRVLLIYGLLTYFSFQGFFIYERKGNYWLSEFFFFLAAITFGAGGWLIAQMFHFPPYYAKGILVWIIGTLPLVFLTESRTVLVLHSFLLSVWLGVYFYHYPQNIPYHYFVLFFILVYLSYRLRLFVPLFLLLCSFPIWLGCVMEKLWQEGSFIIVANSLMAYGFLLFALGEFQENGRCSYLSPLYHLLGLTFVIFPNYVLSVDLRWSWKWRRAFPSPQSYLFILPVIGMYLLSLLFFLLGWRRSRERGNQVLSAFLAVFSLYFLMFFVSYHGVPKLLAIYYSILTCIGCICFLYLAFLKKNLPLFRVSFGFFILAVLTYYFSEAWKLRYNALFFLGGGVGLLLLSIYLEKGRKWLERKLKADRE